MESKKDNEAYRYIKLSNTGSDHTGERFIAFESIEFFGTIF